MGRVSDDVKQARQIPSSLNTSLGAAIKRARFGLGISQFELARRSGLHRSYVSDLERGARNPTVASILKVADALHVSIAEFFQSAGNSEV
jgi:transcriptional regulator with XRE-family HTH domain